MTSRPIRKTVSSPRFVVRGSWSINFSMMMCVVPRPGSFSRIVWMTHHKFLIRVQKDIIIAIEKTRTKPQRRFIDFTNSEYRTQCISVPVVQQSLVVEIDNEMTISANRKSQSVHKTGIESNQLPARVPRSLNARDINFLPTRCIIPLQRTTVTNAHKQKRWKGGRKKRNEYQFSLAVLPTRRFISQEISLTVKYRATDTFHGWTGYQYFVHRIARAWPCLPVS